MFCFCFVFGDVPIQLGLAFLNGTFHLPITHEHFLTAALRNIHCSHNFSPLVTMSRPIRFEDSRMFRQTCTVSHYNSSIYGVWSTIQTSIFSVLFIFVNSQSGFFRRGHGSVLSLPSTSLRRQRRLSIRLGEVIPSRDQEKMSRS